MVPPSVYPVRDSLHFWRGSLHARLHALIITRHRQASIRATALYPDEGNSLAYKVADTNASDSGTGPTRAGDDGGPSIATDDSARVAGSALRLSCGSRNLMCMVLNSEAHAYAALGRPIEAAASLTRLLQIRSGIEHCDDEVGGMAQKGSSDHLRLVAFWGRDCREGGTARAFDERARLGHPCSSRAP